jgi:N6-adenosine-specific RNA methylase IME4
MVESQMQALLGKNYQVVLADPPWRFKPMGSEPDSVPDKYLGRQAEAHYDTMSLDDIKNLPVKDISDRKSSVLFMWITSPFLEHALAVMNAWGFSYKTVAFCWAKRNYANTGWASGMGWYTLSQVELCILGTRGKTLPRVSRSVRQLITAPRSRHSEKPADAHDRVNQMYGAVRRVELFARQAKPGWDVWGNELPGGAVFSDAIPTPAVSTGMGGMPRVFGLPKGVNSKGLPKL